MIARELYFKYDEIRENVAAAFHACPGIQKAARKVTYHSPYMIAEIFRLF